MEEVTSRFYDDGAFDDVVKSTKDEPVHNATMNSSAPLDSSFCANEVQHQKPYTPPVSYPRLYPSPSISQVDHVTYQPISILEFNSCQGTTHLDIVHEVRPCDISEESVEQEEEQVKLVDMKEIEELDGLTLQTEPTKVDKEDHIEEQPDEIMQQEPRTSPERVATQERVTTNERVTSPEHVTTQQDETHQEETQQDTLHTLTTTQPDDSQVITQQPPSTPIRHRNKRKRAPVASPLKPSVTSPAQAKKKAKTNDENIQPASKDVDKENKDSNKLDTTTNKVSPILSTTIIRSRRTVKKKAAQAKDSNEDNAKDTHAEMKSPVKVVKSPIQVAPEKKVEQVSNTTVIRSRRKIAK
ncbi:hypothetical protein AKO1_011277, partial [Acrasis kona]